MIRWVFLLLVGTVFPLAGQDPMPMSMSMPGMVMLPFGLPMERLGSGTSWTADQAGLHSIQASVAGWEVMGHGVVFAQYDYQSGPRGDSQFGSLNWAMLMASHPFGSGVLQFRTMLSLDPATVTSRGYPLLLQTGEAEGGAPIHDRQHPHDFWMELAALYLAPISRKVGLEVYLAPSGEPALGPVAFMHRPSALDDPFAPIGHHWQDATHTSFGVGTIGLFNQTWKVEASLFNAREPDDHRWDFDFGRLDSWSVRATRNSGRNWSTSAGYGHLRQSGETIDRFSASLLYGRKFPGGGSLSSALVYGGNRLTGENRLSHSILLEGDWAINSTHTVFARVEGVEKSGSELVLDNHPELPEIMSSRHTLVTLSGGYLRNLMHTGGLTLGIGVRGGVNFLPRSLQAAYGSTHPMSAALFLRLRPE